MIHGVWGNMGYGTWGHDMSEGEEDLTSFPERRKVKKEWRKIQSDWTQFWRPQGDAPSFSLYFLSLDTAEERAKQHGDILRDLVKNSPKSNRKEGKKNPRNFVLLLNANQQQSEEQLHVFPNFDQFFCLRSKSLEFLKTFSVQFQLW